MQRGNRKEGQPFRSSLQAEDHADQVTSALTHYVVGSISVA